MVGEDTDHGRRTRRRDAMHGVCMNVCDLFPGIDAMHGVSTANGN